MTPEEVNQLKQRLSADWLTRKTDIFRVDFFASTMIKFRFQEYWNIWIRDDLKDLFDELERLRGAQEKLTDLERNFDERLNEEIREINERND